jgi:hypothetical protein
MQKKVVTKFKWFWAWQDEVEEQWLGKMSKKGYHLSSVGLPGFYTFTVAEPYNYSYRLDYQMFYKKDKREYLQLFLDAGWEHIGEMSAWQYFRKEARQGETHEIFTDAESKIAKYKRVLTWLGFFYIMLIFIVSERILGFGGRIWGEDPYPWWGNVQLITLSVLLLLTFAIIKLTLRIRQLKKL